MFPVITDNDWLYSVTVEATQYTLICLNMARYPSGKPAITISMQTGVYTYIAQGEDGAIMAVFQTTGQATSYYANDNIRWALHSGFVVFYIEQSKAWR